MIPHWLACAVCGATTTENAMAFLWMTLMLSLLPLGMIGGGVLWLWLRWRSEERQALALLAETERLSSARL